MKLSIIIKALNEEDKIGAAIASSVAALDKLREAGLLDERQAEIVLGDCLSSDRTVSIALRYPIRIVQLLRPSDRSCGAGAQLAYQHSSGAYVFLLDGDMRLDPDFLPQAFAVMGSDPGVAGVGGMLNENNNGNLEFAARAARDARESMIGFTDKLDGGGLYRRAAIESVGYFADRNLHGYTEARDFRWRCSNFF